MQPAKVAVVIPAYNRWPTVCEAIDSVLAQTYPHIECIVVDDGSSDGTAGHLQRLYGARIRLLALPDNREKSAARNAGVRATDAQYVCMLDSDDLLTPRSVEDRIRLILDDSGFSGVAYGLSDWGRKKRNARGERFATRAARGDFLDLFIREIGVHNNAFLLSREDMLRFGMYREDMTNREDVELIIRLAARLDFCCCGTYVTILRRRKESARTQYEKFLYQGLRWLDHLGEDAALAPRLGRVWDLLVFRETFEYARAYYKAGSYRAFRSLAYQILKRWPGRGLRNGRLLKRLFFSMFRRESDQRILLRQTPQPNIPSRAAA